MGHSISKFPIRARWPEAMRLSVLAEYLDVSESYAQRLVDAGEIPAVTYTERGDRRYLRADADAFLERRRAQRVR